jgi:hypothetical protein
LDDFGHVLIPEPIKEVRGLKYSNWPNPGHMPVLEPINQRMEYFARKR